MKNRLKLYTKAQLSMEYAVLIVCIVLALVAMQVYISRSIQGKWKDSVESFGSEQYAPGDTNSNSLFTFNYNTNTTVTTTEVNGTSNTITTANFSETQNRATNETLGPPTGSLFNNSSTPPSTRNISVPSAPASTPPPTRTRRRVYYGQ